MAAKQKATVIKSKKMPVKSGNNGNAMPKVYKAAKKSK